MFGMPKKFTPEWYNVRNPKAAAIFHSMLNPYLQSIGAPSSEDMLSDIKLMESINDAFKNCFRHKFSKNAIDAKMSEMLAWYVNIAQEIAQDELVKQDPSLMGDALAAIQMRHIVFGVAPGLAQNADHACAIAADLMFILSRHYHQEPQSSFLWTLGSNFKKIGMKCDECGYDKMPADARAQRSVEWWDGYNPAGLLIIAA